MSSINTQRQDYKTVSSDYVYSQGATANYTGSLNEYSTHEAMELLGVESTKLKYQSLYSTTKKAEMDLNIKSLKIAAELRYQQVAGSADEKGCTSLYNAGQCIDCEDFILVLAGPHWDGARGQKLVEMYTAAAANFNKHPETFCIKAKKLHVMRKSEFIEFVKQKKERLQNG